MEKQKISLSKVPEDLHQDLLRTGRDSAPQNILVLPVIFEGQVRGVLELASLEGFNDTHHALLDQLDREYRYRHQYHRSQHAYRGSADAVAVARA